jgi:hypothetical protein
MNVSSYSFGTIVIEGKKYTADVIIYPDHVDASWWRKEGHRLQISDLADILALRPDILIIGTGKFGMMAVPEETIAFAAAKNIETRVLNTGRAVDLYNSLQGTRSVIAALHLTC